MLKALYKPKLRAKKLKLSRTQMLIVTILKDLDQSLLWLSIKMSWSKESLKMQVSKPN